MKKNIVFLLGFLALLTTISCKKYLDEKQDKTLSIPSTLQDLQLLMDNYYTVNQSYTASNEVMADNCYLTNTDWQALINLTDRNFYTWQKDDLAQSEWSVLYAKVNYANVVLDNVDAFADDATLDRKEIKGQALFVRALAFYSAAQLFAKPYDVTRGSTALGIPLRLTASVSERSVRASLQQTYDQITNDLKTAANLLPVNSQFKNRPTKAAALAALARVQLSTRDYEAALVSAEAALVLKSSLINYNELNAAASAPFSRFNAEVIYAATGIRNNALEPSRCKVDSNLYRSYSPNDLRKSLFFTSNGYGTYRFKGDYDGSNSGAPFFGFTTDELLLIKAEMLARKGRVSKAMDVLNQLLINRWKDGTFIPFTAANAVDALKIILAERRKELCFRGQRWTDLRRLNMEQGYENTLKRFVNNQTYSLEPNSDRYTLQIPRSVIDISGMQQNP